VPPPTSVSLEKTYASRGDAAGLASQLRRILPDPNIRVESGRLIVAGSQEDHDKIERLLAGQSVRTQKTAKASDEKLYSMHVAKEPAGKVARTVAENIGKELKYDRQVLEKLKQLVTIDLDNVTLEYLLETTLKPLGLTYRISDSALEIVEQR